MADLSTGAISEENGQLTKFHGLYLQDDRDLRQECRKQGREKAFMFYCASACLAGDALPDNI